MQREIPKFGLCRTTCRMGEASSPKAERIRLLMHAPTAGLHWKQGCERRLRTLGPLNQFRNLVAMSQYNPVSGILEGTTAEAKVDI